MKITDRFKKGIVYITGPLLLVLSVFLYSSISLAAEAQTEVKECPLFSYDLAHDDPYFIDFTDEQIQKRVGNLTSYYSLDSSIYKNVCLGFHSSGDIYVYLGVNDQIAPVINGDSFPFRFSKGKVSLDIPLFLNFNNLSINPYSYPYINYKSWYYGYISGVDGRFYYMGSSYAPSAQVGMNIYPYNFNAVDSSRNHDIIFYSYLSGSGSSSSANMLGFGDLDLKGHSDGFNNDMFDAIAQQSYQVFGSNYHTYYAASDILGASDIFEALKMIMENVFRAIQNLGVLLNKILLSMMWFFDDILVWIRNFWDNMVLFWTNAINLLVGTFDKDPDTDSFFTWFDSALSSFFASGNEDNPFYKLWRTFNHIYDFGLHNNEFDLFYLLRRLIIPDSFEFVKTNYQNLLDQELANSSGTYSVFLNQYNSMVNDISGGVVPTFTIPPITLSIVTIPEFTINFGFLVPYMPMIHNLIAVFMWVGFMITFVRALPGIIAGTSSTAESVEKGV